MNRFKINAKDDHGFEYILHVEDVKVQGSNGPYWNDPDFIGLKLLWAELVSSTKENEKEK